MSVETLCEEYRQFLWENFSEFHLKGFVGDHQVKDVEFVGRFDEVGAIGECFKVLDEVKVRWVKEIAPTLPKGHLDVSIRKVQNLECSREKDV